ncbi:MAG: hypothetical protein AAF206_03935 [Bacteroidota bacterium]
MKSFIVFTLFILSLFHLSAQYLPGYYIDNDGKRTDGFIDYRISKNNPSSFRFKTSEGENEKEIDVTRAKEWGISKKVHFIRAKVKIDRSPKIGDNMSEQKEPDWIEKTVYLSTLVEGSVSLYYYQEGNQKQFYIQKEKEVIEALIYKKFRINQTIRTNNTFQQQLAIQFTCPDQKVSFEMLRYTEKSLQQFVVEYNQCVGRNSTVFKGQNSQAKTSITIRPGINLNSFTIQNGFATQPGGLEPTFSGQVVFRLGIELGLPLPRLFGIPTDIILEPSFQRINQTGLEDLPDANLMYSGIETSAGARFFLLRKNSFQGAVSLLGKVDIGRMSAQFIDPRIENLPYFGVGFGLAGSIYFGRISGEIRYVPQHVYDTSRRTGYNQTLSFIAGYRLTK